MRAVTVAESWAASCAVLAYAHAGFDYVDDVVAQLLALLDDIHIHGTTSVGVGVFVDIVDVLGLELSAIVVDFGLKVE